MDWRLAPSSHEPFEIRFFFLVSFFGQHTAGDSWSAGGESLERLAAVPGTSGPAICCPRRRCTVTSPCGADTPVGRTATTTKSPSLAVAGGDRCSQVAKLAAETLAGTMTKNGSRIQTPAANISAELCHFPANLGDEQLPSSFVEPGRIASKLSGNSKRTAGGDARSARVQYVRAMTPWERTVAALKGTRASAEAPHQRCDASLALDADLAPTPWQRTKMWFAASPPQTKQAHQRAHRSERSSPEAATAAFQAEAGVRTPVGAFEAPASIMMLEQAAGDDISARTPGMKFTYAVSSSEVSRSPSLRSSGSCRSGGGS